MYFWNWVLSGGSPPITTTNMYGDAVWQYPLETADLTFPSPGVSLTAVAGITAFSAAYMAYVGFTEYFSVREGTVTLNEFSYPISLQTPESQPLSIQYLSPFFMDDGITSITVAYGLIPAGMKITDQPAGMPSPTSGLTVTVLGYN